MDNGMKRRAQKWRKDLQARRSPLSMMEFPAAVLKRGRLERRQGSMFHFSRHLLTQQIMWFKGSSAAPPAKLRDLYSLFTAQEILISLVQYRSGLLEELLID